tara:strand:- start:2919 stop:3698 length:780 start_codon:yes stop_codon:yes gene_type:complete
MADWKDAPEGAPKPKSVVAVQDDPFSKKGLVGFEKGKDPLNVGDKTPGSQQITAIGEKSVDLYPKIPGGDWQGPQQSERVYMEGYAPKGSPQGIADARNKASRDALARQHSSNLAKHRRELTDEWGTVTGDPGKGALMTDLEYSVKAAENAAKWEAQTAPAVHDAAETFAKELGMDPHKLTLVETSEENTGGSPHWVKFKKPDGQTEVFVTYAGTMAARPPPLRLRETSEWGSKEHEDAISEGSTPLDTINAMSSTWGD